MSKKEEQISLRQRAEARLKKDGAIAALPSSAEEIKQLLYELQVQKIELELQNEALIEANELFLQTEQQFKNLIESISDYIGAFDLDGTIQFINRVRDGGNAKELVGKNFGDLMANDKDRKRLYASFEKVVAGEVVEFDHHSPPDEEGKIKVFHSIFSPLLNSKGKIVGIASRATDITETYKAKEKDRKFQYLLEETQSIGQIGSWELNLETEKVTWTNETYNIFGVPLGTPPTFEVFINKVHPDDRELVAQAWENVLGKQANYDVEYRLVVNQQIKWARAKATINYAQDGTALNIVGFTQDITRFKLVEAQLRESEEYLKKGAEIAQFGFWKLYPESGAVEGTSELLEIFELEGQPTYKSFGKVIHPDDYELDNYHFNRGIEQGIPWDVPYRLKFEDGRIKWIRVIGSPHVNEEGAVEYIIGAVQDITKDKLVELQIKESEQRFRLISESINEAFYLYDKQASKYDYISPGSQKVLGLSPSFFYEGKRHVAEFVFDEDKPKLVAAKAQINKGEGYSIEFRIWRDGKVKWLTEKAFPIFDSEGKLSKTAGVVQDITERKVAEQALVESEYNFRLINESIDDVFYLFNLTKNRYEYISPGCKGILGEEPDYYYNGGIYNLISKHPDDIAAKHQAVKDIKAGLAYDIEFRVDVEGEEVWLREKAFPILDTAGKIIKVSGIVQDISAHKRAEVALNASKEKFEHLFELSPDFMFKTRIDNFLFVDVNQRACDYYGYTKEEFKQLKIIDIKDPNDDDNSYEIGKYDYLVIGKVEEVESRHQRKDGTTFPVQISFVKIDEDYILATGRDISAQKQAHKRVEDLTTALNEASIVAITDEKGMLLSVNDKFCEISKFSKEELIGKTSRLLISEFQSMKYLAELWVTIKKGKVWTGDVKNKAKDGSFYWVRASMIPFLNDKGIPFQYIAIGTDITAQKQLEEDLREAQKEAVRNAEIKEDFLAHMSHEIRTPMNGVFGFSRLLLQTNMSETQQRYAQSIYSSAESLLAVINDILDVSKIESGTFKIVNVEFDLVQKVNSTLEILQVAIEQKGLQLKVEVDAAISAYILGAPNRIAQILINLIGNAIKFTEEGYIELRIGLKEDNFLLFEVIDSGIGIPEDKMGTIFESFTQIENYRTREHSGTGLGLSISKELVRLMGGEIGLTSELNKGSVFYFTIPYVPCQPLMEVKENDKLELDALPNDCRVLVAEDHPVNQELVMIYLNRLNLVFDLATNGEEALALAKSKDYDLILMDIQMPKMDGMEATRQIRTFNSTTPIVAMTAHALEKEKQKCLSIGMNDYLTKPFRLEELRTLISKHLLLANQATLADTFVSKKETALPVSMVAELLEDMEGDQELVHELLMVFKEEIVLFVEGLEAALKDEDANKLRELRHQMKPSLEMFRLAEWQELVNKMVDSFIENKAVEDASLALAALKKSLPNLLDRIDLELSNDQKSSTKL